MGINTMIPRTNKMRVNPAVSSATDRSFLTVASCKPDADPITKGSHLEGSSRGAYNFVPTSFQIYCKFMHISMHDMQAEESADAWNNGCQEPYAHAWTREHLDAAWS